MGLFGGHQAAFEHKPWVEASLAELGIPHIPWTYVADEDQLRTKEWLNRGPLVLRRSRTSGGTGIVLVKEPSALEAEWPHDEEGFVSVSSYIENSLPLNVGATVWHNGVSVHFPSVQLIGVPNCVGRPFGYCGNDFGLAAQLDDDVINQVEESTVAIGGWLHGFGYRGTFGVDYLLSSGQLLFTEINPRFQGSTHLSCRLSIDAGEGCLMLEHIGALIGMSAPVRRPLIEQVRQMPAMGHFVIHWLGESPANLDPTSLANAILKSDKTLGMDVETKPTLLTSTNAVVGRFTVRDRVTTTGYDLSAPWRSMIDSWTRTFGADAGAAPNFERREAARSASIPS